MADGAQHEVDGYTVHEWIDMLRVAEESDELDGLRMLYWAARGSALSIEDDRTNEAVCLGITTEGEVVEIGRVDRGMAQDARLLAHSQIRMRSLGLDPPESVEQMRRDFVLGGWGGSPEG